MPRAATSWPLAVLPIRIWKDHHSLVQSEASICSAQSTCRAQKQQHSKEGSMGSSSKEESPRDLVGLKFPFFDLPEHEHSDVSRSYVPEKRTFATTGIHTPPPGAATNRRNIELSEPISIIDSNWDSEISPIARSRESGGKDLDVSAENLRTPERDYGGDDDIDTMLSELKSIINQSQTKRKGRFRSSSLGDTATLEDDNDFLIESRIAKNQNVGIKSPQTPSSKPRVSSAGSESETNLPAAYDSNLRNIRKQVDESSHNFINRIRNAAQQRKKALTRSRDTLKAQELDQLQARAAASGKLSEEKEAVSTETSMSNRDSDVGSVRKQFKARPLPESNGFKGMGGLYGVPKVEKKPTTTPFSPLLGSRRPQKVKAKALQKPGLEMSTNNQFPRKQRHKVGGEEGLARLTPNRTTFKARPVPSFIGKKGQGGLTGVPKVQKRTATIPISPVLGLRRKPDSREDQGPIDPTKTVIIRGQASPGLRGLDLLEGTPKSRRVPGEKDENKIPNTDQSLAYVPYSSIRAKKRADYDARRDENMELKLENELKNREKEIQRMHRELRILRKTSMKSIAPLLKESLPYVNYSMVSRAHQNGTAAAASYEHALPVDRSMDWRQEVNLVWICERQPQ
eukprot:scaffold1340_cov122-Cylindrotheca_fusiformis.AAC.13